MVHDGVQLYNDLFALGKINFQYKIYPFIGHMSFVAYW